MKQLKFVIIIMLMLCLVSCGNGQDADISSANDSSAESSENVVSEEEKKQWTEVEEYTNETVTREYLDGENDFTVTVEKFGDNGSLENKSITHYINKIKVSQENIYYNEDGSIFGSDKTGYDEEGDPTTREELTVGELYICKKNGALEGDRNAFVGDIEYTTHDGEKVADGKISYETLNGVYCIVERLNIYTDGEITMIQTDIHNYDMGKFYYRIELTDPSGEMIYSRETDDDTTTYFLSGENGAIFTIVGDFQVFTELNGDLIAEAENLTINTIGEKYTIDNIVARVEEILALCDELSGLIFLAYQ